MSKNTKIIFRNSSVKFAALGITLGITFFLTPFLIHTLGDGDYGIWMLIGSIASFFIVMDLGISSSVVRYVSKYAETKEYDDLNGTVNTCLAIFVLLSILIFALAFILSLFVPLVLKMPPDKEALASTVIIIIGASVALSFPFKVFAGVLKGMMRYDITAVLDIVLNSLRALLVIVVLTSGGGLIAFALITLVITGLTCLANLYFVMRTYPFIKFGFSFVDKKRFWTVFNYSIFTFIASLGNILRFHLDSIVIGIIISVSAITPYSLAQRLMTYFMLMIGEIFSVTTPHYSTFEAKKDMASIRNLFVKSTFYSALISFFVASMFIIYGDILISLWVGETYALKSYSVLLILSIGFAVYLSQYPTISVAYGIEKHKVLAILTVFEGVMNLALSVILARKMGLVGVAIGTTVPLIITRAIIQPVYICSTLGLPLSRYLKECFLAPTAVVGIFTFIHLIAKGHIELHSYSYLALAVIASSSMYFLIAISLFNREQRSFWKDQLSALRERLTPKVTSGI